MDVLAPIKSLDRFQRRQPSLAIPVAVIKKFSDDQGGNLSALIAYYGFFSLFPLLLVFVAGLGFVLDGNPDAQRAVLDSALRQIPIVGEQISAGSLKGNGLALAIGLVGALLAGLGVTQAAQTAFNRVHGVPHRERPNFIGARAARPGAARGSRHAAAAFDRRAGLVAGGLGGPLLVVAGIAVSLAANFALFLAAFRLLTDDAVPTRQLWPGIATATDRMDDSAGRRRHLHRPCRQGRRHDLRDLRDRDRPADVAVPRRAASSSTAPSSTPCSPTGSGRGRCSPRWSQPTAGC